MIVPTHKASQLFNGRAIKARLIGDPNGTMFKGMDRIFIRNGLAVHATILEGRVMIAANGRNLCILYCTGNVSSAKIIVGNNFIDVA